MTSYFWKSYSNQTAASHPKKNVSLKIKQNKSKLIFVFVHLCHTVFSPVSYTHLDVYKRQELMSSMKEDSKQTKEKNKQMLEKL